MSARVERHDLARQPRAQVAAELPGGPRTAIFIATSSEWNDDGPAGVLRRAAGGSPSDAADVTSSPAASDVSAGRSRSVVWSWVSSTFVSVAADGHVQVAASA